MNSQAVDWIECWLHFKLREYQKRFVDGCINSKRVAALMPRQSGKSTTVAAYVVYRAFTEKDFNILIVSKSLSQSRELFLKIKNFLSKNIVLDDYIKTNTQTEIVLQNLSRIRCLPTGPFGDTILGYTADVLIVDESGVIKDEIVNRVLMPMIIATQGQIIKVGTPRGKNHFYQSCYGENSGYSLFHIDWRTCIEQHQYRIEEIEEARGSMTELEFGCEYEAQFMETTDSYFSQDLIDSAIEDYAMMEGVM
jgi:hypothetical protein